MTEPKPPTAEPTAAEPAESAAPSHGVGPWEGEWPDDDRYDPELLRDGDRRNVVDGYR
ncbi:rRNA methyltransferase, partial [Brevibacterium paucivorans]